MEVSLKKNMLWNAFGNIVYLGMQWLVTIIVAWKDSFYDAGVLALAMSISATFQTIAMFGVRNFQVSDIDEKYSNTDYVGFRNITCVISIIACLIFSFIGGYSAYQIIAVLLYMLFRIVESYSDVLHGIAQKNGRLDIAGKSFTIKGILLILAFSLGYFVLDSLNIGILLMALSSLATTVFFDILIIGKKYKFGFYAKFSKCFSLAKETLPLCIYLFLFTATSAMPKLFIEAVYDENILGAYSSIYAPVMLIQMAAVYIYAPFISRFAEYIKNKEYKSLISLILKICFGIAIIGIVAIILSIFLGEWALILVFKEKVRAYTNFLLPILFCVLSMSFLGLFCTVSIAMRDFKTILISYSVGFVICLILSIIASNYTNVNNMSYALAIATICSIIILIVGFFVKIKKKEKENV